MYITLQKQVSRCRGEADSVLWRIFFCWFSKKLPSPPPSNPHIIEPLAPSNAPTRHFLICWQTKACHRKGTSITFLTTRSQNYIQKFWVLVRQRCCLIICSYIGWIDKSTNITTNIETTALSKYYFILSFIFLSYFIYQFSQYNNKYWDGSAV